MEVPVGPMSVAFAGGVAAFVHCIGMCGGISMALTSGAGGNRILRHLSWQGGRAFSYVFLGALAGFSGWFLAAGDRFRTGQAFLAYLSGAVMITVAVLQMVPATKRGGGGRVTALFTPFAASFLVSPTSVSSFFLGMATGLLPCPLIWGFAALAGSTGTVAAGMGTMAALAAGTAAPLALAGLTGGIVPGRLRLAGRYIASTILLLTGLVTLLRPTPVLHHLSTCPAHKKPCCTTGHTE